MPHIRVEVKRSDCVENDVSASKRHLNERAEERKEEEEQIARCGETQAAAATSAAAAVAAPAVAASAVAAQGSSTAEAIETSNNSVPGLKNGDAFGGAGDATTAITTAPAAVAASGGENPSSEGAGAEQGEGGEETRLETLDKQTSMIQADRTDGENWDANDLGKTSAGCWCWRWRRRNVKRSGSLS